MRKKSNNSPAHGRRLKRVVRRRKFKQLTGKDTIQHNDYVTLDARFSPYKLKVDRKYGCASGAWVKLTKETGSWIGVTVSKTPFSAARAV